MKRITWAGCVLIAAAASTARAQNEDWITEPVTAEQLLADRLVMTSLVSLQGSEEPRPDQLVRGRTLFDLALGLIEDRPELQRLRAELAGLSDNPQRRIEALGKYVQLRPEDDAAQLELILHRIRQVQTIDARIAMIDKILGSPRAQAFSEPLRSRLASYAAAGAQEIGDRQRFARWLKEAMRLDSSNPEAAFLMYQYTLEHTDDPLRIGAAMVHLVRCDPTDPGARLEMARWLAQQHAFTAAAEQYEMTAQITRQSLAMEDWQRYVIALVASGQRDAAMSTAKRTLDLFAAAEKARAELAEMEETKPALDAEETGPAPDAEETEIAPDAEETEPPLPPLNVELMRFLLFDAAGQTEHADEAFERVYAQFQQYSPADAPLIAAAFGRHSEQVEAAVEDESTDERVRQRLRGWLAYYGGDLPAAAAVFEPIAGDDGGSALGLALSQTDPQRQEDLLREVIDNWPSQPAGLKAVLRLQASGGELEPTEEGAAVLKLMDKWPRRMWYTDLGTDTWVTMRVRVDPVRAGYLDPIELEVTLRNVSGVPLAVGPQGPVPSRMWLNIGQTTRGQSMGPQPPLVVDLFRTLRLEPGERLTHTVRLDYSLFGYTISLNPGMTFNWSLTATLDPMPNLYGVVVSGPGGGRASVGSLIAQGLPPTEANVDLWIEDLQSEQTLVRLRAAARLLHAVNKLPEDVEATPVQERIAEAINAMYTDSGRIERAWIASHLEGIGEVAELFGPVVNDAERSDDPLIRLPYLISRAKEPDDEMVLSAMRHSAPTISEFAKAVQQTLELAKERAEEAARLQAEQEAEQEELEYGVPATRP